MRGISAANYITGSQLDRGYFMQLRLSYVHIYIYIYIYCVVNSEQFKSSKRPTIWRKDGALLSTSTLGQSGPTSNGNPKKPESKIYKHGIQRCFTYFHACFRNEYVWESKLELYTEDRPTFVSLSAHACEHACRERFSSPLNWKPSRLLSEAPTTQASDGTTSETPIPGLLCWDDYIYIYIYISKNIHYIYIYISTQRNKCVCVCVCVNICV